MPIPAAVENTIERLSSNTFDNGRRGGPLLGCDCVQCFGYCIVDHDMRAREMAGRREAGRLNPEDE